MGMSLRRFKLSLKVPRCRYLFFLSERCNPRNRNGEEKIVRGLVEIIIGYHSYTEIHDQSLTCTYRAVEGTARWRV